MSADRTWGFALIDGVTYPLVPAWNTRDESSWNLNDYHKGETIMIELGTFHIASMQSVDRPNPDGPTRLVLTSADEKKPNRVEVIVHDKGKLQGLSHGSAVALHLESVADPFAAKAEAETAEAPPRDPS